MNTTTISHQTTQSDSHPSRPSPVRHVVGVVARPQSYRNIGYLVLGLPLGTVWFSVLISGLTVGISTLAVALLGIPLLLGMWYVSRWSANVERAAANVLLDTNVPMATMDAPAHGNPWVRLRAMTSDRDRWRELGYLMLRFPAGIATFIAAVTALATPFLVAYAPFAARHGGNHPFGTWSQSARMDDIASSSPWSWLLVPLGLAMVIGSFHLLNALARVCGRWTTAWLGADISKRPRRESNSQPTG